MNSDMTTEWAMEEMAVRMIEERDEARAEAERLQTVLSDLAVIGLTEHIRDLHRELGDLRGAECPFVSAVFRAKALAGAPHE